jgi:ATP-dependent Lon protease
MDLFGAQMPDRNATRTMARRLYTSIRSTHDWGRRFEPEPGDEVLDRIGTPAPREMRRAWMTAVGNARLAGRAEVQVADLPEPGGKRSPIGFTH